MAKYRIQGETLKDIADAIRTKKNSTDPIAVCDFATEIESIASGGGINTFDATATADDILSGKTAYVNGEKITGNIVSKTSSDLTINGANVTVPAGHYATQVTKSVSTTTQATPSISVSSSGLITATATQTTGYVTAGTKSATKQLAFQTAKTITPGTTDQTAVPAGYYTGGAVTVKGDANLIASNIVSGKSIFGVIGTAETGSGGNTELEDALVTKIFTFYTNDRVTTIGDCAFAYCTSLTSVNFPKATIIGGYAFSNCTSLTSVNFPNVTTIGSCAFSNCTSLTSVNFPNVTTIGSYAFRSCTSLTSVNFPNVTTIGTDAFLNCTSLTSVSFPDITIIDINTFRNCTSLTSVSFPKATTISNYAFASCTSLTSVNFPNVTTISLYAFNNCTNLTSVSFPNVIATSSSVFANCTSLISVSFPKVSFIGYNTFLKCTSLTSVSLPKATTIGSSAFKQCFHLVSLYLTGSSLCTLSNSNAFSSTPIGGYSASAGKYGSIYVPASLLTSYKTATNWTYFSSRFVGV